MNCGLIQENPAQIIHDYNIQHSFALVQGSCLSCCGSWIPYFSSCVLTAHLRASGVGCPSL